MNLRDDLRGKLGFSSYVFRFFDLLLFDTAGGSKQHGHNFAFQIRHLLDSSHIGQFFSNFSQVFESQFRVSDFATTEAYRNFHFHAVQKPAAGIPGLERPVVFVGFGSQANFLDLDFRLCSTCFTLFFGALVKKLSKIHDPADGWFGIGGDLYQIQFCFAGDSHGFFCGHHTQVFAFWSDQTDFRNADGLIYPKTSCANNLLPFNIQKQSASPFKWTYTGPEYTTFDLIRQHCGKKMTAGKAVRSGRYRTRTYDLCDVNATL
jgi:hypothetical protein